jgi:SNF2 family DNA or RNA helicase
LGQKNAVNAIYFLAQNTIDEEIFALIEQKREIVNAAIEGSGHDSSSETVAQKMVMSFFDLAVATA